MAERYPTDTTPLATTSTPARHVAFDTEAHTTLEFGTQIQTWACGAAVFVRNPFMNGMQLAKENTYDTPRQFWDAVIAFTRPNGRTVCWAHNLAYDLRISRALEELPRAGFELEGIVLERTASWASFKAKDRSILCIDLAAWVPGSLESIARDLGHVHDGGWRPDMDLDALKAHCAQDARVVARALVSVVSTIVRHDLGPFRATGAGQSTAAWRRRFHTHPVRIHCDTAALAAERAAMWTGRCEAWAVGDVSDREPVEFDFNMAYCRIGASCDVPSRIIGTTTIKTADQYVALRSQYAVLAEVTVSAGQEVVPAHLGSRVHWPVGDFETTLWDPEIDLLVASNATINFGRVWLYQRAPVLGGMCGWLLSILEDPNAAIDPVTRRMLKHFSRAVVGRMALRYRSWEDFGTDPHFDIRLSTLADEETGRVTDLLQVGHRLMELTDMTEADMSAPQVTSWVMSEARRRLWRVMLRAGLDHVLYVDTDGLIVDRQGARRLRAKGAVPTDWQLRIKSKPKHVEILGPRNLIVGDARRLAGVPKTAVHVGGQEYDGEVWRSIKESMTRGELGSVVVTPRLFRVSAPDHRRTHLDNGATAPHQQEGHDES